MSEREKLKTILEDWFKGKCIYNIDENCVYLKEDRLLENGTFKILKSSYGFEIKKEIKET